MADRHAEFQRIYDAHHATVLAHAAWLVGPDDAQDVAQQVWLRVFRRLETFRGDAALSTWLYVVTRNAAKDHFRLRDRRGWACEVVLEAAVHAPSDMPNPETSALLAERRALVDCWITALQPDQQAAMLSWVTGYTVRERGEMLGIPTGTVKSRTYRAINLLVAAVSSHWRPQPFMRKTPDSARAS